MNTMHQVLHLLELQALICAYAELPALAALAQTCKELHLPATAELYHSCDCSTLFHRIRLYEQMRSTLQWRNGQGYYDPEPAVQSFEAFASRVRDFMLYSWFECNSEHEIAFELDLQVPNIELLNESELEEERHIAKRNAFKRLQQKLRRLYPVLPANTLFPNLRNLSILIAGPMDLACFLPVLSGKLDFLTSFDLEIEEQTSTKGVDVASLLQVLPSRAPNLRDLRFNGHFETSAELGPALSRALSKLSHLQTFGAGPISLHSDVVRCLGRLPSLCGIDIHGGVASDLETRLRCYPYPRELGRFPQLRSLNLQNLRVKPTAELLNAVSNAPLDILEVDADCDECILPNDLELLGDAICQHAGIKTLSLGLEEWLLEPEECRGFWPFLDTLEQHLHPLSFSFRIDGRWDGPPTDAMIEELANAWKNLRSLSLHWHRPLASSGTVHSGPTTQALVVLFENCSFLESIHLSAVHAPVNETIPAILPRRNRPISLSIQHYTVEDEPKPVLTWYCTGGEASLASRIGEDEGY